MKTILSAAAISLLVCNAATAQTLLGQWQIEAAAVAPWVAPDKIHTTIKEADVRRFVKQRVTFEATAVKSRDPIFACKGATLRADAHSARRLVPGRPAGTARPDRPRARMPDGPSPGVDVACPNSRFSYHFRDKDTALFALDNVIYTLKRR